jgi:diaminopimelate epimerase
VLHSPAMGLEFAKMSGAGNTFVVIDNRAGAVESALAEADLSLDGFVIRACSPLYGVGADGLILLEGSDDHDFAWRFYNADGSQANMCGNGARCAARYARLVGAAGDEVAFETGAGVVRAEIRGTEVRVALTPPGPVGPPETFKLGGETYTGYPVDTGVPHVVIPVPQVSRVDVEVLGPEVRNDPRFAPAGTNVNFVSRQEDGSLRVRTFERGVEGETMACGTGVTASALVLFTLGQASPPVTVVPLSGEALTVDFRRAGDGFADVTIVGPARVLFRGELEAEALH